MDESDEPSGQRRVDLQCVRVVAEVRWEVVGGGGGGHGTKVWLWCEGCLWKRCTCIPQKEGWLAVDNLSLAMARS